jgi:O-antigen ligase
MGIVSNLGYFIWVCSIIVINKTQKDWYRCIGGLLLGATLAGILTVIISIFNWEIGIAALPPMSVSTSRLPFLRRVVGAPLSFGSFGMLTIGTFAYSYARWKAYSTDELKYFLFGISSLFLFGSLIISQSRSTWVATVVATIGGLTTLYLIKNIESDFYLSTMIRYIGGVVGLFFLLSLPIIVNWLINIGKVSLNARIEQYLSAIVAIRLKPLFGTGQAYDFDVPYDQIHNAYLKLGAENGILAPIIVIILIILVLVALWRTIQITNGINRLCATAVFVGVIGVVIESQFVAGFSRFGWVWFALAASFHSVNTVSQTNNFN